MITFTADQRYIRAPRRRLKYLKRRYVVSDEHPFVGRIDGLSIVQYNFDSYEEMAQYPDCLYALSVGQLLSEHFGLFLRECEWRFNTPDPKRQLSQLKQ